jgi:hypothetical protein
MEVLMSRLIAAISLFFLLVSPALADHDRSVWTRFLCTTEEAALEAMQLRMANDYETLNEKTIKDATFKCLWAPRPIGPISDYQIVAKFDDPREGGQPTYLLQGVFGDRDVWLFGTVDFVDGKLHLSGA